MNIEKKIGDIEKELARSLPEELPASYFDLTEKQKDFFMGKVLLIMGMFAGIIGDAEIIDNKDYCLTMMLNNALCLYKEQSGLTKLDPDTRSRAIANLKERLEIFYNGHKDFLRGRGNED